MPAEPGSRRSTCPINHAVEILGDRWTMLVVRDMVFHHKASFSELRAMPEGIATNVLSNRLARLEAANVITKGSDPEDGRRNIYELTDHGRGLIPILLDLMVWSRTHTDDVDVSMDVVRKIRQDRDAAVAEIERRLTFSRADAGGGRETNS
ncbi:MAG: helix-turn-helix domain-containing protein [Myxococcota bacterium]